MVYQGDHKGRPDQPSMSSWAQRRISVPGELDPSLRSGWQSTACRMLEKLRFHGESTSSRQWNVLHSVSCVVKE